MRAFPRIALPRLRARRRRRSSGGRDPARTRRAPAALVVLGPLVLLVASCLAYAEGSDGRAGVFVLLASALNRLLCRATGPASYVTFFYAQFDDRRRRLSYVKAGHNPPLLVRTGAGLLAEAAAGGDTAGALSLMSEGPPLKLEAGGPVLGLFEGCRYEEGAVGMRGGDILVGYTDGVVEALNAEGAEFGEERLLDAVAASARLTAAEICDRVVQSVGDWSAGAPQHDDLTLVVLKVAAPEPASDSSQVGVLSVGCGRI
jgi:hypothetical protein